VSGAVYALLFVPHTKEIKDFFQIPTYIQHKNSTKTSKLITHSECKFVPLPSLKACRGSVGISPLLNLATRSWLVSFTLRSPYLREKKRSSHWIWGWVDARSDDMGDHLLLLLSLKSRIIPVLTTISWLHQQYSGIVWYMVPILFHLTCVKTDL
jgi:hypothetical protein